MAKLTIWVGAILVALGAWGFFGTGSAHPTALIPAYFGLALALSGMLAISPNEGRQKLWMHVAVTVGLLGFLGAGARLIVELVRHGGLVSREMAIARMDQFAMAVVCMFYVGLCVRAFIAARRGGKLDA